MAELWCSFKSFYHSTDYFRNLQIIYSVSEVKQLLFWPFKYDRPGENIFWILKTFWISCCIREKMWSFTCVLKLWCLIVAIKIYFHMINPWTTCHSTLHTACTRVFQFVSNSNWARPIFLLILSFSIYLNSNFWTRTHISANIYQTLVYGERKSLKNSFELDSNMEELLQRYSCIHVFLYIDNHLCIISLEFIVSAILPEIYYLLSRSM